jgi:hypothetical protein
MLQLFRKHSFDHVFIEDNLQQVEEITTHTFAPGYNSNIQMTHFGAGVCALSFIMWRLDFTWQNRGYWFRPAQHDKISRREDFILGGGGLCLCLAAAACACV